MSTQWVTIALLCLAVFPIGTSGCERKPEPDPPMPVEPLPEEYFEIRVERSSIKHADTVLSAEEVARKAEEDGRPIKVVWDDAWTDAENELQSALKRARLTIELQKEVEVE